MQSSHLVNEFPSFPFFPTHLLPSTLSHVNTDVRVTADPFYTQDKYDFR